MFCVHVCQRDGTFLFMRVGVWYRVLISKFVYIAYLQFSAISIRKNQMAYMSESGKGLR